MASNLEAKAREIVETWSDFKGGSFSGSDLWDLSKKISAALREERERAAKIADDYERASRAAYEKIKDIADGTALLTATDQAFVIAALLAATDQAIDIAALLAATDQALVIAALLAATDQAIDIAAAIRGDSNG